MKIWERELREKLNNELPEGCYNIGTEDLTCLTGKQGRINFEVELVKLAKEKYTTGIDPYEKH